jgi:U3 small nucleolar RNA-associated protein 12
VSLYGHKMPVLCLDYSTDDTLIVSGSADKYIRVWGSDFGDCHFALLAHSGPVTQVAFVRQTHYVLSAGRDGSIKYWDTDRRLLVKEIASTGFDVWGLAVSSLGDLVVASGKERLLRCFKQTKEQIFAHIEEESRKEKVGGKLPDHRRQLLEGRQR